MAREIKFRGLSKTDSGIWHYGFYVHDVEWARHYIFKQKKQGFIFKATPFEIKEGSVGQFTGLIDKNGVEIYEGDILQGENSVVYSIYFDNGSFLTKTEGFFLGDKSGEANHQFPKPNKLGDFQLTSICVIGNIHSNPELLK